MTHIPSNAPTLVKIQKKLSPFNYLVCSIHSRMLYLFCSSWIMLFALGILTHASSKDGESPLVSKIVWLLFALNVAQLLRVTVQDVMLYSSPHKAFVNTTIRQTADELLACARTNVPTFVSEWKHIDDCLKSVELYDVPAGRVPYMRGRTVIAAFVHPILDSKSVFATPIFKQMSLVEQALVVIHECAHIGFGAVDYAYHWQEKYKTLTTNEHRNNADSYMHVVRQQCTYILLSQT